MSQVVIVVNTVNMWSLGANFAINVYLHVLVHRMGLGKTITVFKLSAGHIVSVLELLEMYVVQIADKH